MNVAINFLLIVFVCFQSSEASCEGTDIGVTSVPNGSAFALNADGDCHLVTAGHVFEAWSRRDPRKSQFGLVAGRDIALSFDQVGNDEAIQIASKIPQPGERVSMLTLTGQRTGTVLRRLKSGRILLDLSICKGDSGSPCVDSSGECFGVAVAYPGCQGGQCGPHALAEPLVPFRKLQLRKHAVEPRVVSPQPRVERSPDRQGQRIFRSTQRQRQKRAFLFRRLRLRRVDRS